MQLRTARLSRRQASHLHFRLAHLWILALEPLSPRSLKATCAGSCSLGIYVQPTFAAIPSSEWVVIKPDPYTRAM